MIFKTCGKQLGKRVSLVEYFNSIDNHSTIIENKVGTEPFP